MALTLVSAAARAQGDPNRGPEVALRTGIMLPFGDRVGGPAPNVSLNNSLDNYASKALPLVLEGGFRFNSNLFVGLRFQYALPMLENICQGAVNCDGSVITLGVEGTYRLMPVKTFKPWVGAGLGYEWASVDRTGGVVGNPRVTYRGIQPLLQGGGDIYITPKFFLGPVLELAFGRYNSVTTKTTINNTDVEANNDITDEAWHVWMTLGIRGAFDP